MIASLVFLSQDVKRITQDHTTAKNMRVGSIAIPEEERRSNQDSSCGLYINNKVRARSRAAHNAKMKKVEVDKINKDETMIKQTNFANRRETNYLGMKKLLETSDVDVGSSLTTHKIDILLNCFHYIGGDASKLQNKKKGTVISALVNVKNINSIKRKKAGWSLPDDILE